MLLVLSLFLAVYGSMHFYFFRRLSTAMPLGAARVPVLIFLLLMTFAPVLVRWLEQWESDRPALVLAYLGYGWMGVLFLFCVLALPLDLIRLLQLRFGCSPEPLPLEVEGPGTAWRLSAPAAIFWLALLAALASCAYGYREALDIRLERVRITSDKLPPGQTPLRIVQITDIHLGLIVKERRLDRMLEVVAAARPDLLLATGDIVDGQADDITPLAERFRRLETPLGKYAVLGNHEYYVGEAGSVQFHEDAGFTVLRGRFVQVAPGLVVAGVDDPAGVRMGETPPDQEQKLLAGLPVGTFNILLKHQPGVLVADAAAGGSVDLQLSGHIHRGQIFPFNLFTWLAYRVSTGLSVAADGRYLYVGRGTGTWGPPIRFLAPPEVTLFELIPAPVVAP